MEHPSTSGPASLKTICERIIFRHRDWLGDIGSVPVVLLEGCLHACSARQLARIEDETREGGLEVSLDLACHWQRCYEQRFGRHDSGTEGLPLLEDTRLSPPVKDPVVDWRAMHEWREEQYEAKLRASGERLKQMTAAESCGKDSRSIQVLNALPRRAPGQRSCARSAAQPMQAAGTRQRLLRKLGMGSAKPTPAPRFKIIRRVPVPAVHGSRSSGPAAPALQLTECELDLTPLSSHFIPHALGNTYPRTERVTAPSHARSASQALQMTDNRFISQPAFEERLRSPVHKQTHNSTRQLQASSGKQCSGSSDHLTSGATKQGPPQADKELPSHRPTNPEGALTAGEAAALFRQGKQCSDRPASAGISGKCGQHARQPLPQLAAQALRPSRAHEPHTEAMRKSSASLPTCSVHSFSRGKVHMSPQPKQSSVRAGHALGRGRVQASPQPKQSLAGAGGMQNRQGKSVAEQPAKRVKYDHLLNGSALLSFAGRQKRK